MAETVGNGMGVRLRSLLFPCCLLRVVRVLALLLLLLMMIVLLFPRPLLLQLLLMVLLLLPLLLRSRLLLSQRCRSRHERKRRRSHCSGLASASVHTSSAPCSGSFNSVPRSAPLNIRSPEASSSSRPLIPRPCCHTRTMRRPCVPLPCPGTFRLRSSVCRWPPRAAGGLSGLRGPRFLRRSPARLPTSARTPAAIGAVLGAEGCCLGCCCLLLQVLGLEAQQLLSTL